MKKLTNLRIEEVSSVDDPAHEAPGWAVQKSRGPVVKSKGTSDGSGWYWKLASYQDPGKLYPEQTLVTISKGASPAEALTAMRILGADLTMLEHFGYTDEDAERVIQEYAEAMAAA